MFHLSFKEFESGVHVNSCQKVIEETVLFNVIDKGFGASTNLLINFAIMVNMLLGFWLPGAADYTHLKTTQYWKAIACDAIHFALIAIIILFTVNREDS